MANTVFQLLMLRVDGNPYAIDVDCVLEVLEAVQPERIIDQSDSIAGLINVRGDIIAVHSIRHKLSTPERPVDPSHRIILINDHDSKLGLLVDQVETVQLFQEEQLFAQSLSPKAFKIIRAKHKALEIEELRDFITRQEQED
ncbi:MAG: chemotaxis protein CheW [Candidatus Obscuribacterales bacterium]|nr:chemotaxis protein CheW [Candidatus Obscuribacterales bacterium]